MKDIIVSPFMPGGYTQAITAKLTEIVTHREEQFDFDYSGIEYLRPGAGDFLIKEVALRSLCIVAACFQAAANAIMALPFYSVVIFKVIAHRSMNSDLLEGVLKASFYASAILLGGIAAPLLAALISPREIYYRSQPPRDNPHALDVCNMLNFALYLETLPEPRQIMEQATGMFLPEIQIDNWRNALLHNYISVYCPAMPLDAAASQTEICDINSTQFLALAGGSALIHTINNLSNIFRV